MMLCVGRELEELWLDQDRGERLSDGVFRRQWARSSAQIEVRVLPHFGAEAKGDEL